MGDSLLVTIDDRLCNSDSGKNRRTRAGLGFLMGFLCKYSACIILGKDRVRARTTPVAHRKGVLWGLV